MISKLKRKFIILATVSMLVLMAVLVLIMNIVNYSSVVSESDTILDVLLQPGFDQFNIQPEIKKPDNIDNNIRDFIPKDMSPEVPYESRYFTVAVDSDGSISETDFSRIISVDEESVEKYIEKAVKSKSERGFVGQFRYAKTETGSQTKIMFLDCGRKIDSFKTFFRISTAVGLLGCIIVFVAFLFASGKIVKPIAESYEKQKQFISDAGHEIKTPLTIINANVDLLESDVGENEELADIRTQTNRLTALTNDLILLSKMEEKENRLQKTPLPFSDIVFESAQAFNSLAISKHIEFILRISPDITVNAAPQSVRQLVSILVENAIKYSPDGGIVSVDLVSQRKTVILSVFNTTIEQVNPEGLSHIFDRFYRSDASRNSQTGGYGIGLSIAKAICDYHEATISAKTNSGYDFMITAVFPK